ncbi:MAG: FAD-dependent thymidylate synthase [archaeon]
MNIKKIKDGKVELIASPKRVYTDLAARFVRSERELEEIIATPYSKQLVKKIIESGHEACTEFDWFIFGIQGFSRVTEAQLIRKRLASYMIKSGRIDLNGKRDFNVVFPDGLNYGTMIDADSRGIFVDGVPLDEIITPEDKVQIRLNADGILRIIEDWYNDGIEMGYPEEDLRYLKPQATEFKAIIGMNAHSLRDWFKIRCCKNAQKEIRDLAWKMLKLCKKETPDLFEDAGPNCIRLGYCPENSMQHESCKGKIITKNEALELIKNNYKG